MRIGLGIGLFGACRGVAIVRCRMGPLVRTHCGFPAGAIRAYFKCLSQSTAKIAHRAREAPSRRGRSQAAGSKGANHACPARPPAPALQWLPGRRPCRPAPAPALQWLPGRRSRPCPPLASHHPITPSRPSPPPPALPVPHLGQGQQRQAWHSARILSLRPSVISQGKPPPLGMNWAPQAAACHSTSDLDAKFRSACSLVLHAG